MICEIDKVAIMSVSLLENHKSLGLIWKQWWNELRLFSVISNISIDDERFDINSLKLLWKNTRKCGSCINFATFRFAGEPIYEAVKTIPANSELVVYYRPERPEEIFFMPAVHFLRHSMYRRTIEGEYIE